MNTLNIVLLNYMNYCHEYFVDKKRLIKPKKFFRYV